MGLDGRDNRPSGHDGGNPGGCHPGDAVPFEDEESRAYGIYIMSRHFGDAVPLADRG